MTERAAWIAGAVAMAIVFAAVAGAFPWPWSLAAIGLLLLTGGIGFAAVVFLPRLHRRVTGY